MKDSVKKVLGEFFGSAFISFWGLGFIVPFAVTGGVSNMFEFALWFGLGFAITVIAFAPSGGAHVNPGVTLAWAIFGGFEKKLILPYIVAQILGWGLGIVPVYAIYWNQMEQWAASTGGNPATLFFCHSPADHILAGAGLEIAMTALLIFAIFLLLDERVPNRPNKMFFPVAIGGVVSLLVAYGGSYSGTAINTARDLAPRLVGYVYGLLSGHDVSGIFTDGQWIMYIVAPIAGALIGGLVYHKIFAKLLPKEKVEV